MVNKESCARVSKKTIKMQECNSTEDEPTSCEQPLSEISSQLATKTAKFEILQQVKKEQLAKLATLHKNNEDQALTVEQRQQNEDDCLNELLAVTINSFRSQFNEQLEFFRHKEQMRCNLEQLQACNKKRIELETNDCGETCISQKDRVKTIQEELKTLEAEKCSIQLELNEHADTKLVLEGQIRQTDAELQRQMQDLQTCDAEHQRVLDSDAELLADEQKYKELEAEIEQFQERQQASILEMAEAEYHLKFMPESVQRQQKQVDTKHSQLKHQQEQFQRDLQELETDPAALAQHNRFNNLLAQFTPTVVVSQTDMLAERLTSLQTRTGVESSRIDGKLRLLKRRLAEHNAPSLINDVDNRTLMSTINSEIETVPRSTIVLPTQSNE